MRLRVASVDPPPARPVARVAVAVPRGVARGVAAASHRGARRQPNGRLAALERLDDRRLDPEPSVALRDAPARLRPRQRRLLTMQAAGLTYGEIAAATGDSLRTVDRQLVRSRAALRAALET